MQGKLHQRKILSSWRESKSIVKKTPTTSKDLATSATESYTTCTSKEPSENVSTEVGTTRLAQ